MRLTAMLFSFGFFLIPGFSEARILWSADFETRDIREMTDDGSAWGDFPTCKKGTCNTMGSPPPDGYSIQVVDIARTGNYGMRYEVREQDKCMVKEKIGLCLGPDSAPHIQVGEEQWIGFSIYIPPHWNDDSGSWFTVFEYHCVNDCSVFHPLSVEITDGFWDIESQDAESEQYPIKKGKWNDVVIHWKMHPSNGFVKAWVDGAMMFDYTGSTAAPNETFTNPGFMVYAAKDLPVPKWFVWDSIKIGDVNSSFEEVSPGRQPPESSAVPAAPTGLSISHE